MTGKPYHYLLLLLPALFLFSSLKAQPPALYLEHFFGGTKVDFGGRIKRTIDNGFVIAGYGASVDGDFSGPNNGFNDFELVKTDSCGNKIWGKIMGGNHQDLLYAFSETTEHGFLLSGLTFSTNLTNGYHGGVEDAVVCKVDANGNTQWIKTFGGSQADILFNAVPLPDSSCIIVGFTSSLDGDGSPQGKNGWVMKLDKNGNIVWKNFPGTGGYYFYDIVAAADGNFVVCDYYGSVVKIDGAGNLLWQQNYGGSLLNIEPAINGGYIVCGVKNNATTGQDGYAIRIDETGNLLWQQLIGGSGTEWITDLVAMPDTTFVFAGYSNSADGDVPTNHGLADGFAFALADNGTLLWTKSYGGSGRDEFQGVTKGADGSVILSGFVGSSNGDVSGSHPSWDFVLLKLKDKKTKTVDTISCKPLLLHNIPVTHDTDFVVTLKDICNYDSAYIHYHVAIRPETVHTINNTTINFLEQITLTTIATGPVSWSGPGLSCYNCLSPITSPANSTHTYIVQTGNGNCTVADTVIITVKPTDTLYVPSAFTPNGDGKNDYFNALGIVADYSLEVFNRWGQRIFKTSSLQNGWNGTYNGAVQPPGTFVYYIRYNTLLNIQKKLKGTFTLIR